MGLFVGRLSPQPKTAAISIRFGGSDSDYGMVAVPASNDPQPALAPCTPLIFRRSTIGRLSRIARPLSMQLSMAPVSTRDRGGLPDRAALPALPALAPDATFRSAPGTKWAPGALRKKTGRPPHPYPRARPVPVSLGRSRMTGYALVLSELPPIFRRPSETSHSIRSLLLGHSSRLQRTMTPKGGPRERAFGANDLDDVRFLSRRGLLVDARR